MNEVDPWMDCVAPNRSPFVSLILVHDCTTALDVGRILDQSVVFIFYIFPGDLLLNDSGTPIVVEPWRSNFLLRRRRAK